MKKTYPSYTIPVRLASSDPCLKELTTEWHHPCPLPQPPMLQILQTKRLLQRTTTHRLTAEFLRSFLSTWAKLQQLATELTGQHWQSSAFFTQELWQRSSFSAGSVWR